MRYKLDQYGYVITVAFGCYLGTCEEYTGEVPQGYNSLSEWAENACINAYYIKNGNLVLDEEKLAQCKSQEAIDKVENTPILRKDLFESEETLKKQYKKATVTGTVVRIDDINPISPSVKITGVNPLAYSKLSLYTNRVVMFDYIRNFEDFTISGVTFTYNTQYGYIKGTGTATEDVEFTLAGNSQNTVPIFVLKKDVSYYLANYPYAYSNIEFRYFDGETTHQQYVTNGNALIELDQSIKVTEVVMKIPKGTTMNHSFNPTLNIGTSGTNSDSQRIYKLKSLEIDFTEVLKQFQYSPTFGDLYIENGAVVLNINGVNYTIGGGYVGLFEDFNTIYATEDVTLEVTYSTHEIDVDSLAFLQGKATTTNKFKILTDGSIEAHNGYFSGNIETNNIAIKDGGWLAIGDGLLMSASGGVQGSSSQFGQFLTSAYTFCTRDGNFSIYNGDDYLYHFSIDGSGWFGDDLWCLGKVRAPEFVNTSAEELKKNFEKLKSGLDIINAIDIYKYNYINEQDDTKKHIGLVIGEKFKYSIEVTSKNNEGVELYSLVSVCVKAIQEQQEQINQLKAELAKLK